MGIQKWLYFVLSLFLITGVGLLPAIYALSNSKLPITQQWSEQWQGQYEISALNMVIGDMGDIYIIGTGMDAGISKGILLKFSPTGGLIWSRQVGTGIGGSDVAVDGNDGAVYATGNVEIGGGHSRAFLVKYHSNGTMLWNYTWGTPPNTYTSGIAISNSSDIYVGTQSNNITLIKFNAIGQLQWERVCNVTDYTYGFGVTTDIAGNIYFVGQFWNTTNSYDIFLLKYNATGDRLWTTYWHGVYDFGYSVAVDKLGNCYVAGCIDDYTNCSALVLKFDSLGHYIWNYTWRGAQIDCAFDVAVGNSNLFLACGASSFYVDPGDGGLLGFGTDGSFQGSLVWGVGYGSEARSVVVRGNSLFVAGTVLNMTSGKYDLYIIEYEITEGGIPSFSIIYILFALSISIMFKIKTHTRTADRPSKS